MYGTHDFFGRFDSDTSVDFPPASWSAIAEQDAWAEREREQRDTPWCVPGANEGGEALSYAAPFRPRIDDDPRAVRIATGRDCRRSSHGHRRRARHSAPTSMRLWGPLFGALTALVATTVILVFWISSAGSLRHVAVSHTSQEMARIWPVVIYGPWIVACVSSLLGAFDRHRIAHSWVLVVLFSGVAAAICSRNSLGIPSDMITSGLPPIAAAISFHQLLDHIAAIRLISQRRSHAGIL